MGQLLNKKLFLFGSSLQSAPYFFAGVDRTFFSSISLFAALFFSALSCAFGGEFCGLRGLVTGSVAVLSPPAAASTSTVATLQSPPPTIVDFVLSHELLTIVKRILNDLVTNRSNAPASSSAPYGGGRVSEALVPGAAILVHASILIEFNRTVVLTNWLSRIIFTTPSNSSRLNPSNSPLFRRKRLRFASSYR